MNKKKKPSQATLTAKQDIRPAKQKQATRPATLTEKQKQAILTLYKEGKVDDEIILFFKETDPSFSKIDFRRLYNTDSEFADIIDTGRMYSKSYWMELARKGIATRSFNTSLFNKIMEYEFSWRAEEKDERKEEINFSEKSEDWLIKNINDRLIEANKK